MIWLTIPLLLGGLNTNNGATVGQWAQFRGPNAAGVAVDAKPLPAQVGPATNLVWKTPLPVGHSSPVLFGDRIYVTAADDGTRLTIALDRTTGSILWKAEAPLRHEETLHAVGNHAQPTPATDGSVIISLFGQSGLFAYDPTGKLLWSLPLGPFRNDYGVASSPILVGDRVILNQDHDTKSFLAAYDKQTGKQLWKTDRSEFPRSFATPVIWEVAGKKQIVVAGTLRLVGYDFDTGTELWTVRGLSRIVNTTPVIGPDNVLYASTWSPGGEDAEQPIKFPSFAELLAAHDADKNGTLEQSEFPDGPIKQRFSQMDHDQDGHVTKVEYERTQRLFDLSRNVLVAIKPGGVGDITQTHVLWTQKKYLPYCPSPVYHDGTLYFVRDSGMFSSVDAKTGKALKQERIAGGRYFSSPVVGDGKLYALSERGTLTVLSAEPQWKLLGTARFEGEEGFATPAIADGRLYVRTSKHLYCFGLPTEK